VLATRLGDRFVAAGRHRPDTNETTFVPGRHTATPWEGRTVTPPFEAAPETDGVDGAEPAAAFAALSDPLRVEILRALNAHRRETGEHVAGFAALRKRVGVRDSGRFRYHLDELREHFVEKIETGEYRLTNAGRQVVAAIVAGTYTEVVSLGPETLDSTCPACGTAAVARYESGHCTVTCGNDHALFQWAVAPNAAADATLPAVVDLAELLAFQAIKLAIAGRCARCFERVDPAVTVDDDRPVFRAVCEVCGGRAVGPATFPLVVDPAVAAFCRDHGLSLREDHVWEFPFVTDESAVASVETDPVRVTYDVALHDDRLRATVDDEGQVVDVIRPGEE